VGFDASLNPYRGCEHGCAYCYARPTHEYLGFSAGLDFESRILVKIKAPELLRSEMARKTWKPQCLVLSGVTDAYQPIEGKLNSHVPACAFWPISATPFLSSQRIILSRGIATI